MVLVGKLGEIVMVLKMHVQLIQNEFMFSQFRMSGCSNEETTDIILFADHDAIWPPTLLPSVYLFF
jgi:hypothetical protein